MGCVIFKLVLKIFVQAFPNHCRVFTCWRGFDRNHRCRHYAVTGAAGRQTPRFFLRMRLRHRAAGRLPGLLCWYVGTYPALPITGWGTVYFEPVDHCTYTLTLPLCMDSLPLHECNQRTGNCKIFPHLVACVILGAAPIFKHSLSGLVNLNIFMMVSCCRTICSRTNREICWFSMVSSGWWFQASSETLCDTCPQG